MRVSCELYSPTLLLYGLGPNEMESVINFNPFDEKLIQFMAFVGAAGILEQMSPN